MTESTSPQKRYYEANKEKVLARQKQYDDANRERIRQRKKEYYMRKKLATQLQTISYFRSLGL
jgi:hypothetical protein